MKLTHTILYVKDVARAVQFYQAALGLTPGFMHESGDYAEMETGPTCLAFAAESLGATTLPGGFRAHDPAQPPAGTILSFEVEDVSVALVQAVAAGGVKLSEPERKPWGQEVAYLRDPDGALIEFTRWVG